VPRVGLRAFFMHTQETPCNQQTDVLVMLCVYNTSLALHRPETLAVWTGVITGPIFSYRIPFCNAPYLCHAILREMIAPSRRPCSNVSSPEGRHKSSQLCVGESLPAMTVLSQVL
jgi:hypothetical protein